MEYLGKLHQAAVEFPQTDIWMDSCGEEELEYGLKRGIVGATSNPIIVGNVIKNELNIWEKRIKEMVVEMKDASEEDIAWELIYEIGALRSKTPSCFRGKQRQKRPPFPSGKRKILQK